MVGPDWTTPTQDMPPSWQNSPPTGANNPDLATWWERFDDPQLNKLIKKALENNLDLAIAVTRVREARAAISTANAKLLPSLDTSLGSSTASNSGLASHAPTSYAGGLDLSWELDIFGGNQRSVEASLANYLSTSANTFAIRTSLLAEVATLYFDWISYTEQLRVAEQQLVLQEKSLSIATRRQAVGDVSMLDVEQARASVANTQANIPVVRSLQVSTKNAIATLLGNFPGDVTLNYPSKIQVEKVPTVPTGLPSDLLRRRPDIIGAELDFYAATSTLGVAISDLYPKFSLTGGLNSSSRDFSDWFRNNSTNWSLGGMVRWPLFSGGAIDANIRRQEAVKDRSAFTYQQSLLVAVKEVENALVTYANSKIQLSYLVNSSTASNNAANIALRLYTEGETEFLNVVTAQQQAISSEESVIRTRQRIRQNVVQLVKALGGGW